MYRLIVLLLITILSSCISGSFKGLTNGYKSENDNLTIRFDGANTFNKKNNKNIIYATNGIDLQERLAQNDKSMVYFWSVNCHSDVCAPLFVVQRLCDKNNIELYIVLDYYDSKINKFYDQVDNAILSADHKYYKTRMANKLSRKFRTDLIGTTPKDTLSWYRYFYFNKGGFSKAERKISLNE